jgi:hypothetical protein
VASLGVAQGGQVLLGKGENFSLKLKTTFTHAIKAIFFAVRQLVVHKLKKYCEIENFFF